MIRISNGVGLIGSRICILIMSRFPCFLFWYSAIIYAYTHINRICSEAKKDQQIHPGKDLLRLFMIYTNIDFEYLKIFTFLHN